MTTQNSVDSFSIVKSEASSTPTANQSSRNDRPAAKAIFAKRNTLKTDPQPADPQPIENTAGLNNVLSQAVFESWVDGLLVLTEQGEWVEANEAARRICERMKRDRAKSSSVPEAIWRVCSTLIESRCAYPKQPAIIESEISLDETAVFRVRARWFSLNDLDRPYLLVILEDRDLSSHQLAVAEVDRYSLTPREAEVWLLHRTNYTYKEIAAELYISVNTVKKHMKSIYAKREGVIEA